MVAIPTTQNALRFLVGDAQGNPFRQTRAWISPAEDVASGWRLSLDKPDGWSVPIEDLKHWALLQFGGVRTMATAPTAPPEAPLITFARDEVVSEYLRAIVRSMPEDVRDRASENYWVLMPAIADPERRGEYERAIEAALPDARVLLEPEMVLEYFRLVRRELRLKKGTSNFYLVVDAGAATTNLTFVLTRKDKTVSATSTARDRSVLQARYAVAPGLGGQWVDQAIGKRLGWWSNHPGSIRGQQAALADIEQAKIRVATTGQVEAMRSNGGPAVALTQQILSDVADEYWVGLLPVFQDLAARLYDGVQQGERGEYFRRVFAEGGISSPSDIHKAINGIVLAGGTSLLPGFRRALQKHIFKGARLPTIHRVGADYPVVAAVGAMAHVLETRHRPRRLHVRTDVDHKDSLASAVFEATPLANVYWTWRRSRSEPVETSLVFDRYSEFAQNGGVVEISDPPDFGAGTKLYSRLTSTIKAETVEQARTQRAGLVVVADPVRAFVRYDPDRQVVSIESTCLKGIQNLRYDLSHRRSVPPAAPVHAAPVDEMASGSSIWTEGANDVVIDLGMSKTIALTARAGAFLAPTSGLVGEDPSDGETLAGR